MYRCRWLVPNRDSDIVAGAQGKAPGHSKWEAKRQENGSYKLNNLEARTSGDAALFIMEIQERARPIFGNKGGPRGYW